MSEEEEAQETQETAEGKKQEKTKETLPAKKEDKKSLIQEAKEAAAELRLANEEKANLLKEEKDILERREALATFGGQTEAGQEPVKKEETPQEYAKRISEGKI